MDPQINSPRESVHRPPDASRPALKRRVAVGLLLLTVIATVTMYWHVFSHPSDVQLLQSAVRLTNLGKTEAAISLFDQILKRNPTESTALLYRGHLARESGDLAAAARFWSRVPDKPASLGAKARFLEGTLFLESHRARDAEAALLRALQLEPDYLQAHEQLLGLYVLQLRESGVHQELQAIRRIRPLQPDELYELVFRMGIAPRRAMSIPPALAKYIAADPGDVDSQVALARHSTNQQDVLEAMALLRHALSQRPDDVSIRAYLAEVLVAQSDLRGAREQLAGAPLAADALPCVWKSHGLYWMAAHEWLPAILCLRRYLAMNPYDYSAEYQLMLAIER
ncbi:MAG TPA: tetratricopeptide repeat protein, partial [Planctomycetaceae bacterium]